MGAKALPDALVSAKAAWELETTAHNLRSINQARENRDEIFQWAIDAEKEILKSK